MNRISGRRRKVRPGMSVKLKITLWFTAFMTIISGICLILILTIDSQVARNQAYSLLSDTVRENVGKVRLTGNRQLDLDEDFSFYKNGVYILLYNKNKALLSGQTPPYFPVDAELENGVTKAVSGSEDGFYVFDLWVPSGWEDGVWIRGTIQRHNSSQEAGSILSMFFLILPFIILSASLGGYLIVRRALEPIEQITKAAGSITEGRDLTRRIGLTRGSDEALRLANSFDHMFERLEHSFETEKQFASDASHELRTPTAVILAQCGYIRKYAGSEEEYLEGVAVIERQAQKMSLLINRLLDMTRLEFGTRKLAKENTDVSLMVETLCEELDTGARGISLERDIKEHLHAQADAHLLSRAIMNLLENARKYGKDNGHIRVKLHDSGDNLILEVEDDGIGIAPEHQEKIWQRFYQVNSSRQAGSGLGLGLSMVRQIVQLHDGDISVNSRPGVGSCFTVVLPKGEKPVV